MDAPSPMAPTASPPRSAAAPSVSPAISPAALAPSRAASPVAAAASPALLAPSTAASPAAPTPSAASPTAAFAPSPSNLTDPVATSVTAPAMALMISRMISTSDAPPSFSLPISFITMVGNGRVTPLPASILAFTPISPPANSNVSMMTVLPGLSDLGFSGFSSSGFFSLGSSPSRCSRSFPMLLDPSASS